jgi:hypothetical protein
MLGSKATSEDWARYYDAARKRRSAAGGDPLRLLVRRNAIREKAFLIGSSVFIAGLLCVFYALLAV